MQEEYNNIEKKIHSIIYDGEENEYSQKVGILYSFLSKKKSPSRKFEDFQTLIEGKDQNKIIEFRKNTMNKKITIILAAAALLLVGVFVAVNQSSNGVNNKQEQVVQTAKIVFITGEVTIKMGTGEEINKPKIGAVLGAKDVITTANKSSVELEMSNGSTIKLKSNSEFTLTKMVISAGETEEEVFLKRGVLVADVKKKKKNDSFKVTTPTVIAGVRGTKFQVEVNPNKSAKDSTIVVVEEGSVGITKRNPDGTPASVEPIEIIDANQQVSEKGFGGAIVKNEISPAQTASELAKSNDANSEKELLGFFGKTEIERITLEGNKTIRGVIIHMDDNYFTIQTMDGIIKVARSEIISSDTERLK